MTSKRQIAANRRNAQRSTGPRSLAGKLRSRANAFRHGLTAETVVSVFENPADYREFEDLVINQYDPRSVIERQLVLRLSSLLWRLRRATAIETGLLHIQGQIMMDRRADGLRRTKSLRHQNLHQMFGLPPAGDNVATDTESLEYPTEKIAPTHETNKKITPRAYDDPDVSQRLAQCFMRVSRLDNQLFDRLGRYEVALWRQAAQVIRMLAK